MGVFSNKISKDELKPADHIYSWRNAYLYSHHGIYAGDGKVIHFTRGPGQEVGTGTVLDRVIFSSSPSSDKSRSPCPVCGDQSELSGVISSCLECFLWEGELYRFEYDVSAPFFLAKARGGTCTLARSDPPEDVLRRASFLLEKGFGGYNLFKNNCEDFAIYSKTGLLVVTDLSVGRSGQMTSIVAAVSAVVSSPLRFLTTSFSGLAVVSCGMYCASRLVSDIGVRRDVRKIPVETLVSPCVIGQVVDTLTPAKLLCDLDQPAETATFKEAPAEITPTAKAAGCKED
ncbi:protein LEAD-SENSITIVE 1-like [Silene latifolia]|uniref:protein LEAD-SENSITIVE 1-like n=1 Tax=Silene latifolia TaxID=37657 RepID=UPI003D76C1A8